MSNFLDNIVGFISPIRGLQRERARAAIGALRKYEAAATGRRTSGWHSTGASANTEISAALPKLRERARDLVRNNPYAKNAIDVITSNTIGTGIIPRPRLEGDAAKKVMESWNSWAGTKTCDFDGRLTFYGMQALVMRTIAESGEVLILKRTVNDKKNPLRLQVLEPDFIDTSKNFDSLETKGYTIDGIEFDQQGKRVAYWLYDRHPGDNGIGNATSKRVPADSILHIYSVDRPGQVRGVPFGASAFLRLHDFDEYEDAQLVKQKIAACFAVFVQDASADAIGSGSGSSTDNLPEKVEPGIIEKLPAGKTIAFASPPAAEGYGEYSRKILQAIAAGYGVTYEALTGDLSNVNFSSGRMGWLEFHRRVAHWQYNIIIPFLDEIWSWFSSSMELTGNKTSDVFVDWTPPRREMIDPVKETNAISLAIRNGLTSWQEAVREQGYDPNTVLEQIAEDNSKADEKKIVLDCDPRFGKTIPIATAPKEGAKTNNTD